MCMPVVVESWKLRIRRGRYPRHRGFQDDREIWEVTHVCDQDLETTEGVDFLPELLDLTGWTQVNDEETEKD